MKRTQSVSVMTLGRLALVAGLALSGCRGDAAEGQPALSDTPSSAAPPAATGTSPERMAGTARNFLAALSPEQREAAVFAFDADAERTGWSNLPASIVTRSGVRLGDLTDEQRRRLHHLLRASTSSQGYQKVAGVIRLDEVLHEEASAAVESGEDRIPERLLESWTSANYWIAVFGQPGDPAWGWLVNGHHMAASFTVVDDRIAFTPLFLGAEPHEIERGLEAGWRVLANEGERGWRLLQALSAEQRAVAVLGGEIPFDVLAGPGRKGSLSEFSGIQASSLNEVQRTLMWELVEEFAGNADHAAADAQLEKIRADGLEALHFAWIGPTDDQMARYYYRVHGPSVLIEYIVEEGVGGNAANHVHSIMRDPGNDYGEDWLGKHYEEHHER
ncbi:MAG: DUF3500 domain-containing protein [Gemmatimonadales bacterium]|nr:DUF3500 domain-containing protein [Gemmatimonadales bacterium]MYG48545.1 DUF3500 domain-containing protein [Gemmatimonadales bacterium]MYK03066.1 DUF3500 domain-containing protein [Candidatus Palauibacter ramosifaciens]